MVNSGIYEIRDTLTGKKYIGSAVDIPARRRVHLHGLRKGRHHSKKLQRAWDARGEHAFAFSTLLVCCKADLLFYEQRAIDALAPFYNSSKIAGSRLGLKATDETRAKISLISASRSAETRAKMSASAKQRRASPETRARMSLKQTLLMADPARREMLSLAFTGRPISPEQKSQLSELLRGNTNARGAVRSAETRAKLSAAQSAHQQRKREAAQRKALKK